MTITTSTPDCNHCRRRPAAPDRKRCRPCLEKAASNSRKRYARLAAKAACTRCGRRRVSPGQADGIPGAPARGVRQFPGAPVT